MSDEQSEDFLGLNDPDQARAEQGPALVVGALAGGHELRALDRMRLETDEAYRDHWRIIFVDEDDQFEKYDGRGPIENRSAEVWRTRMSWPKGCEPTPDDVLAWLAHRRAALLDKWSPRLATARAQDELAATGMAEPG